MARAFRRQTGRRSLVLALLATTAIAALSGGCTKTGNPFSREPKLAAADSIGAISQWASAYAKKPQDPKMALGYAQALKAIGSRDKALEILTAGYRANPTNGEIAAELGRLALDLGRVEIAAQTLKVAEAQEVRDWRTLSAQGTLRAKRGQHAEAQQYFLAALQEKPDAVSVINNLALSYALDGKADKSEELLRQAVDSGHDDRRVRQNLALVLGLQGKFDEARQVAAVDMSDREARSNMAYLQNMLSSSNQFAAAKPATSDDADDWTPFAANDVPADTAPNKTAVASPPSPPKMQVVKAEEMLETPAAQTTEAKKQPPASPKPEQLAGTPRLVTPASATQTVPGPSADLLRTEKH